MGSRLFLAGRTLLCVGLRAKRVDAERRALDTIGDVDRFVEVVHWKNGNQRTETLLREHRIIGRVHLNQSRLDKELLLVHRTSQEDLALGVIDHGLETLEGALIDDTRVVRRSLGSLGVEFLVGLLELLDDRRQNSPIDQQVVLRRAHLAGIQQLTPKHPPRDESRVGILGDNGRVDSTQLQHDRSQVRSGSFGDNATDIGTAREEDLIPALRQQGLSFGDSTLDDGVAGGVEGSFDDALHHDRTFRGIFAGLDHHRITGRDGTDDRTERQLEGIVECAVRP